MLMNTRPDPAPAAHDRVYRGLRTRIMHGEIAPAQALTLRGIGKEFDVSMTPAREAVRRLVNNGVKVIEHGLLIDEETARLCADKGIVMSTQVAIFRMGAHVGDDPA